MATLEQVEAAILALEAQRGNLGAAVVDIALAPLRAQLATLRESSGAAAQTRLRRVTVLFADIVDSTALGAGLEAEDILQIVSGALARFGALVETHRGRVARFTGDGLKGIFGAEADTEDAPENAVRAGLAILADAERYAATLRATHGVSTLAVRVGVNTGLVALGGGVEADNTAMGTAVNLASRLEQAAPPNGLLISHDTFVHVRGLFDVVEQPPLLVKGHAAPLDVYVVERARPRAFRVANRGVAGVEMRMVGRDVELARLVSAYGEVAATNQLRAVTVFGDAGVGKSRLLAEFQHMLGERHRGDTLLARARPHLRLEPYGLVREMLAAFLRIADTDSAETARRKWRDGFTPFVDITEAEMLGHLLGLDFSAGAQVARIQTDARQLRDRAFRASLLWLKQRATAAPPLVFLVDDLHWADQGSLNWVRHVLDHARDVPVLLVFLTRPVLLEAHPRWVADDAQHQRVDVAALGADASVALVRGLLQKVDEVPPALLDIVTRGAEGNPFFMEELVNMLIDDGVIVRSDDSAPWRVAAEKLGTVKVPATITGVLQARIDALAPRDRVALQQASIIGPVFWDAALDALESGASRSLPALTQRQMTARREPSAFADCAEFAFSHHLLHQATYETVLKAERRAGHARAADWLAARTQERALEHLGATADHFERAGNRAQAAEWFARAARAAAERYANDAALENSRRALDSIDPADVPGRFELLHLRTRVFDVLGQREAQAQTLDEMEKLAPPGALPKQEARIAVSRALLADRGGDFVRAVEHARHAIALAEPVSLWTVAALAYGEWAYVLAHEGEVERAREKAASALEHARRSGDSLTQAQITAIFSNVEQAGHHSHAAIPYVEQAIVLAVQHGHSRLASLLYGNLGEILMDIGDYDGALHNTEAGVRMSREIGNRSGEANATGGLAAVHLARGDPAAALVCARQALEMTSALGDRYSASLAALRLGEALYRLERVDDAVDAFHKAEETLQTTGTAAHAVDPAVWLARVALEQGDREEAKRRLAPVLTADTATLEAASSPLNVEFTAYRVLRACDDARAGQWLASARRRLDEMAKRIPEGALRQRFLDGIALHRAVRDAA